MLRLVHALMFIAALLFSSVATTPPAEAGHHRAHCHRGHAGHHHHHHHCYRYLAYRGYWLGYGGYPVRRWGGAGYRPADDVRYADYFSRYLPAAYTEECYVRRHRGHRHVVCR